MNPIYSVGLYLIGVLLTVLCADGCMRVCLGKGRAGVKRRVRMIGYPIAGVFTFLPIAGAFLPDSSIKFALTAAGNIWLGFFVYFGGCILLLTLLFLIASAIRRKMSKSFAALVLILSFGIGIGVTAYGMVHARQTKVTRYEIALSDGGRGEEMGEGEAVEAADPPQGQDKSVYRIVLLGDLHLSVNSSLAMIQRMVDLVNAENPDVIVIAGDIFTSTYAGLRDPEAYAAVLRALQAKEGVYMVAGNHDVEETLFGGFPISPISEAFRTQEMEQFFADCNFKVLDDALAELAGGDLILAGRLDGEKAGDGTINRLTPEELLEGVKADTPVIVLQHEPVEFAALKEAGADLALCGHTHNGQMFPGNLLIGYFNLNPYGYRIVDGLKSIVTSGVGFYGPPMRVGTDSEIAVIDLTL